MISDQEFDFFLLPNVMETDYHPTPPQTGLTNEQTHMVTTPLTERLWLRVYTRQMDERYKHL